MTEYRDKKDKFLTSDDIEKAAALCSCNRGQCRICPLLKSPAICTEVFARYIDATRRLLSNENNNHT